MKEIAHDVEICGTPEVPWFPTHLFDLAQIGMTDFLTLKGKSYYVKVTELRLQIIQVSMTQIIKREETILLKLD